jgi:hypothetical protein
MTNLNESRAAPRSQRDMASSNCYSGIYLRVGAALQGLNIDGPGESEDIAIRYEMCQTTVSGVNRGREQQLEMASPLVQGLHTANRPLHRRDDLEHGKVLMPTFRDRRPRTNSFGCQRGSLCRNLLHTSCVELYCGVQTPPGLAISSQSPEQPFES